jgi:mannosyltransferase OCH1-like enzyme
MDKLILIIILILLLILIFTVKQYTNVEREQIIPKVIYQTYKTDLNDVPVNLYKAHRTWVEKNPDYKVIYMNDNEIDSFIKNHFDKRIYNIFNSLPAGVMKADFFRYSVIYINGGVYADMDTECIIPCREWISSNINGIICLENEEHLCQWTFAFSKKHPLLKEVIDLIVYQIETEGINTKYEHFIHKITGPAVWTRGIKQYLNKVYNINNINNTTSYIALDIYNRYKNIDNQFTIKEKDFFKLIGAYEELI